MNNYTGDDKNTNTNPYIVDSFNNNKLSISSVQLPQQSNNTISANARIASGQLGRSIMNMSSVSRSSAHMTADSIIEKTNNSEIPQQTGMNEYSNDRHRSRGLENSPDHAVKFDKSDLNHLSGANIQKGLLANSQAKMTTSQSILRTGSNLPNRSIQDVSLAKQQHSASAT